MKNVNMKLKPLSADFEAMPEIDFTDKLNNPVSYVNTFDEIVQGLRNPEVKRRMGEELMDEIFIRAYNYTVTMFAGYNCLSYICMMYAEELKRRVSCMVLDLEFSRTFLVGLKVCGMDGRGPVVVTEPYLTIEADTAEQAVQRYTADVPVTAYWPAHVVAYREKGGNWQLLSDIVTAEEMKRMLNDNDKK